MSAAPLHVRAGLEIPADELLLEFARAGGPGGQNVNKVETKVVLRFSPATSRALSEDQRRRVIEFTRARLTAAGELMVQASRHRERARNIEDARERLAELLAAALTPRKTRRDTKPTRGSVRRRLDTKKRRSATKRGRSSEGD